MRGREEQEETAPGKSQGVNVFMVSEESKLT